MSFSRLALRLAVVEALCPSANASGGPWPTWAGAAVYDSRIEPISDSDAWRDFVAQVEGKPIVTVYTEEQKTSPTAGEYPADHEMVDLVVEIMIAAAAVVETPEGPVGSIEAPITNSQHEAMLDLIEQQVRNLVDPGSAACPLPLNWVAMELHHVRSAPMRDAVDRLSRQAARTLTFDMRVRHTGAYARPLIGADPVLASLPEPLRTVALALAPQSAAGQLVRMIASGQPPAPHLTPLRDVNIYSSVDRGVNPTATDADLVSNAALR